MEKRIERLQQLEAQLQGGRRLAVGFLDALLGGRQEAEGPAPDRLFAMTTAYMTLETGLDITSAGAAGIVFQPLATADFEQILKDAEELLHGTAAGHRAPRSSRPTTSSATAGSSCATPTSTTSSSSLNTISTELQAGGYGDRLLARRLRRSRTSGKPRLLHLQLQARQVLPVRARPRASSSANTERELRLKAQLDNELPIEPELERWFPLWEIPL